MDFPQRVDAESVRELLRLLRARGGRTCAALLAEALRGKFGAPTDSDADGDGAGGSNADVSLRAVHEVAWEHIHGGPWKDVHVAWRDAYALTCLAMATTAIAASNPTASPAAPATPAAAVSAATATATTTPLLLNKPAVTTTATPTLPTPARPTTAVTATTTSSATAHTSSGTSKHFLASLRLLDLGLMLGGNMFRAAINVAVREIEARVKAEGRQHVPRGYQCGSARDRDAGEDAEGERGKEWGEREEGKRSEEQRQQRQQQEQPQEAQQQQQQEQGRTLRGQTPAENPPPHTTPLFSHPFTPPIASPTPPVPLPPRAFSSLPMPRAHLPSLERFLQHYMLPGVPVLLQGVIAHWPALKRWADWDYLKRVAGARTVPVEMGSSYLAEGWTQELMTLGDFIDRHVLTIPILRADIDIPPYCWLRAPAPHSQSHEDDRDDTGGSTEGSRKEEDEKVGRKEEGEEKEGEEGEDPVVNAWFGPAGTLTPLHHDPCHNLFAQVVGCKYVRVYSSREDHLLYAHTEKMLSNSSQVDVDAVDGCAFPLFPLAPFWDVLLAPGDLLYIPPRYWHYVKATQPSCSVSFWWKPSKASHPSN
ncbi:hypothetical protein CLOP_g6518 [Closterium sp. NIES-67]|nr:hypothetical protein CLOP_g6518 [Closterium sp. NIES-67]